MCFYNKTLRRIYYTNFARIAMRASRFRVVKHANKVSLDFSDGVSAAVPAGGSVFLRISCRQRDQQITPTRKLSG